MSKQVVVYSPLLFVNVIYNDGYFRRQNIKFKVNYLRHIL